MLVLTRRMGESVRIGPDLQVRVVAVEGSRVRLAFIAPRQVPIWRAEVLEREGNPPTSPASPARRPAGVGST